MKVFLYGIGFSVMACSAMAATLYRDVNCGCCKQYAKILKSSGIAFKDTTATPMAVVKNKYKIPGQLQSCHTVVYDGLVVEGHVPLEAVKKALRDSKKGKIYGIALAGMPMGSPGMGPKSAKREPFKVMRFDEKGNVSLYGLY